MNTTLTETVTYSRGERFASLSPVRSLVGRPIASLSGTEGLCVLYSVEGPRGTERALLWVEAPWTTEAAVIEARTFGTLYPEYDRRKAGER